MSGSQGAWDWQQSPATRHFIGNFGVICSEPVSLSEEIISKVSH